MKIVVELLTMRKSTATNFIYIGINVFIIYFILEIFYRFRVLHRKNIKYRSTALGTLNRQR